MLSSALRLHSSFFMLHSLALLPTANCLLPTSSSYFLLPTLSPSTFYLHRCKAKGKRWKGYKREGRRPSRLTWLGERQEQRKGKEEGKAKGKGIRN